MAQFYEADFKKDHYGSAITTTIKNPLIEDARIEIDEELYNVLIELQRESRHSVHIENIPDIYIPHERYVRDPEQLLIDQVESTEIAEALDHIPEVQRRRFLLRYLLDFRTKDIAAIEKCSTRAIKYSIALAKRNLKIKTVIQGL